MERRHWCTPHSGCWGERPSAACDHWQQGAHSQSTSNHLHYSLFVGPRRPSRLLQATQGCRPTAETSEHSAARTHTHTPHTHTHTHTHTNTHSMLTCRRRRPLSSSAGALPEPVAQRDLAPPCAGWPSAAAALWGVCSQEFAELHAMYAMSMLCHAMQGKLSSSIQILSVHAGAVAS